MYRPVRRHVDIKAQTLFTVIVPIPKRWVVRRHTTKKRKKQLTIPRFNEHFGCFSANFDRTNSRYREPISPVP